MAETEGLDKHSQDLIKKVFVIAIFLLLAVVGYFVIQPFLSSMLIAFVLAFLLRPLYKKVNGRIKNPGLVALIFCTVFIVLFSIALWFTLQFTITEAINFYTYVQTQDILKPLKLLFSKTGEFPSQLSVLLTDGIKKGTASIINSISQEFIRLPALALNVFVLFFVLFYFLRDGADLIKYLENIMPFKKEVVDKIFLRFKNVTYAIIYGLFFTGLVSGVVTGIGFYLFGVPNPFVLSIAAIFFGILPIIGTWIIWIPASIYMILQGNTSLAIGLIIYCMVSNSIVSHVLLPRFVGKKAEMANAVALVGMLGGLQLLGVVGLIIGPLVLDYFILCIEFYKQSKTKMLI